MKPVFTGSKLTKHFKMNKQTKRMMALMNFPGAVHLSASDQKLANTTLTPMTKNEFKTLMIGGQLASADSKLSGLNDPFWKQKKEKPEEIVVTANGGVAGTAPSSTAATTLKPRNKGKKVLKMRSADVAAENASNNNVPK